MLEQYVLEYGGFSATRARCHVILDRETSDVLVGDPRDNPGTSVTNAIEQVAFDVTHALSVSVSGGLYEYASWDIRRRRAWIARVEFHGDACSLPVWTDADRSEPFVAAAVAEIEQIQPYTLTRMGDLPVVNQVFRVRIEAAPHLHELVAKAGVIQHISQSRFYYVDVQAKSQEDAVNRARAAVAPHVAPEGVQTATRGAPLDQPGTLPM